ncbi:MAG: ADP-forming succinate--CoA ligase subunit beta [Pseudomonadota bacterium]
MNIHEYQAKELLRSYGIVTTVGATLDKAAQAAKTAAQISGPPWVVKAQIHAGGRGAGHFIDAGPEGGGVHLAKTADEASERAQQMLGACLVTKQTGAAGRAVHTVLIEQGADIKKELYLSVLIDRRTGRVAFVASSEGGMDIEAVAEKTPEKICVMPIDPVTGPLVFQLRRIADVLGVPVKQVADLIAKLYRLFTQKDCALIEINPLVVTGQDTLLALDGKINFDDNSLYRQKDIEALRDPREEDPAEREAEQWGLSYVRLDGDIGCMVNGAGLAMATLDILTLHGGQPANFLDVGGGASAEQVTKAFSLIVSDTRVKSVLVNIFGGIMRCDTIAEGIISAARTLELQLPLVVRLAGTNVELGKAMLAESGLAIQAADDLDQAAALAAKAGR